MPRAAGSPSPTSTLRVLRRQWDFVAPMRSAVRSSVDSTSTQASIGVASPRIHGRCQRRKKEPDHDPTNSYTLLAVSATAFLAGIRIMDEHRRLWDPIVEGCRKHG